MPWGPCSRAQHINVCMSPMMENCWLSGNVLIGSQFNSTLGVVHPGCFTTRNLHLSPSLLASAVKNFSAVQPSTLDCVTGDSVDCQIVFHGTACLVKAKQHKRVMLPYEIILAPYAHTLTGASWPQGPAWPPTALGACPHPSPNTAQDVTVQHSLEGHGMCRVTARSCQSFEVSCTPPSPALTSTQQPLHHPISWL